MENKITTGCINLDNLMGGGIPRGNLTVFTGKSKISEYFTRLIPETNEGEKGLRVMFNLKDAEAITKHGQCVMDEMLLKLKEGGFDTSKIKRTKTVNEKIGDTWFPVTYYEDGTVTVGYPRDFCEQVNNNNK